MQQYIGFFVIARLLELFTAYVRSANGTIREAGINFKSKEIWWNSQRGDTIRESGTIRENTVSEVSKIKMGRNVHFRFNQINHTKNLINEYQDFFIYTKYLQNLQITQSQGKYMFMT